MMFDTRGSLYTVCNRTCSTNECDTCRENPNKSNCYIATSGEYIPDKVELKKLTKFEKLNQKKNWKAIQDKHSKRR